MATKKKTDNATKAKAVKVTVRGVTVEVDADSMNDVDVLEWYGELQDGNIFAFPKLAKRILGDEQFPMVKKALAGKNGVTAATDMVGFFTEMMNAISALEAKN